jgi:hypothetical protein
MKEYRNRVYSINLEDADIDECLANDGASM